MSQMLLILKFSKIVFKNNVKYHQQTKDKNKATVAQLLIKTVNISKVYVFKSKTFSNYQSKF